MTIPLYFHSYLFAFSEQAGGGGGGARRWGSGIIISCNQYIS